MERLHKSFHIENVAFVTKSPGRLSDGDQRKCVNLDEGVGETGLNKDGLTMSILSQICPNEKSIHLNYRLFNFGTKYIC